jgi:hypothetical protein
MTVAKPCSKWSHQRGGRHEEYDNAEEDTRIVARPANQYVLVGSIGGIVVTSGVGGAPRSTFDSTRTP